MSATRSEVIESLLEESYTKLMSNKRSVYRNKRDLIQSLNLKKEDVVLDVGFSGQGVQNDDPNWPHAILKSYSDNVYGIDLEISPGLPSDRYQQASAENFDFPVKFDLIFAGDLIEHLSNPGLFLESCRRNLAKGGRVILTTPNTFNLFNIAEKFTKYEPTVNPDHTFYFNSKTLKVLLAKNKFKVIRFNYVYSLEYTYRESFKKKFLNFTYDCVSRFTDKFTETLVVEAISEDV